MSEQQSIRVYTTASLLEQLDTFMIHYTFDRIIICPQTPNKNWKPRAERVCRFCNKSYPETTFRSDAHHLPEFLGNKYLIFQEECDACNLKFADYESHLSAFLSASLTFFAQKGKKNKVPKYRASDGLRAEQQPFYGIDGIVLEKSGKQVIKMDINTGKSELEFTRPSYIPLMAYKALLKIAATSLLEEDLPYYSILLRALASEEFDEPLSQMALIKEYWLPYRLESPSIYLFKIKTPTAHLPTHICMLYFGNQAFQFVVPACSEDTYMKQATEITPIYCPPFYHFPFDNPQIHQNFLRLDKREKVIGEKVVFHFESDPEILKNLRAYDPETKQYIDTKLDPNDIVKLIVGKMDDSIDLPLEER